MCRENKGFDSSCRHQYASVHPLITNRVRISVFLKGGTIPPIEIHDVMNTKHKSDSAVGQAIGYYTSLNFEVLLPIGDKRPYDLVVDNGEKLIKIQSKFTSEKRTSGSYRVELRVTGGNKSRNTRALYNDGDFDFLFVYTDDGQKYHIPFAEVIGKHSVTLGQGYSRFAIESSSPAAPTKLTFVDSGLIV